METLIYLLKAHLLFMILGGIYHFSLRNEKSFTFNRIYLLAIYGASVLAPLLDLKLFRNITFIEPTFFDNNLAKNSLSSNSPTIEGGPLSLELIIPFIYGLLISISITVFLIRFIKSFQQFKLLHRFAKFDYNKKVYWVEDEISPVTFMNKTLLPKTLQNDEHKDIIIKHEEAHRKTLHFFDIIWVELLSSLLVLNPLNKKMKKYVRENHEFLADEYACEVSEKNNYVKLLVEQTLNQNQFSFASYFAKPTILNRLNMLQNDKKSKSKPILIGLSLMFISFIFSCDLNPEEEVILKSKSDSTTNPKIQSNETVDDQTVFSVVEKQAEPKGGIQSFYNALSEDMIGKYPQEAINLGIEGVVYLQFTIEKDGSLTNIQPVKGIGGGCDKLAVELLQKQSKWLPGKHNGKIVRSQRVIPIRFVLK